MEWIHDGSNDEILKERAWMTSNVESFGELMREEERRGLVIIRERVLLCVGSGLGVFGGVGLLCYGFVGWRKLNKQMHT